VLKPLVSQLPLLSVHLQGLVMLLRHLPTLIVRYHALTLTSVSNYLMTPSAHGEQQQAHHQFVCMHVKQPYTHSRCHP
jgi:hypothetical protein